MKNNLPSMLSIFALISLLTLSGCKESYTIVTTIFPDGSCDRVMTVTSRSREIPDVAFPLPLDSTWELSWKEPKQEGEKYELTMRKHFAHVDSLSQEYAGVNDSGKVKITISVEKRFRWFHTYFTYREKFFSFTPYTLIPPSQFMTQDEIRRIVAGEKSDSLKQKRDAWEMRNLFEEYYQGLVKEAEKLNHPSLPVSLIESNKEALFHALSSEGSGDPVTQTVAVLRTSAVRKLDKELRALVSGIEEKSRIAAKSDGDYINTVLMPGTILDTNAEDVKGNSVVWRFTGDQFGVGDYEMIAESRSVNVWAVAATGIFALFLVVLPVALRMREERRAQVRQA
jgi:hypothetical protein